MKRIRILHTADIHLDAAFAALGLNARKGDALRSAQRQVFTRMMAHARDWPADLVLIAGDLFDSENAASETLAFVLETLEHLAPIPVYIAPGNRDPHSNTSLYALALWPDNVTVFAPGAWRCCDHPTLPLAVHGIGYDGSDDFGGWFNELRVAADTRVHIALAHGTERAHQPPHGKCFGPFDAEAVAQDNLAYLALGHFHDGMAVSGDLPTVMRYPGTPQGRTFQEPGERTFLEVVIAYDNGAPPTVQATPVPCADIVFERRSCVIAPGDNAQERVEQLAETVEGDPSRVALQVEATGTQLPPVYEFIETFQKKAASRFFHAEVVNALEPMETLPFTAGQDVCLSKVDQAIAARIADAPEHAAAAFEAYTRDLVVKACRSHALPTHDARDPLS